MVFHLQPNGISLIFSSGENSAFIQSKEEFDTWSGKDKKYCCHNCVCYELGLLVCLFAYSASNVYGEKLQWKCCHRTTYYCTTGYDCSKDAVFHQPQEHCSGDHELHFVTQEECLAGSLHWYPCFHIFHAAAQILALLRLLKMHLPHFCQTHSYSARVEQADLWEHRLSVWRQFSLQFVETGSSRNKHHPTSLHQ